MSECEICGRRPEGSETACLDCETPLPMRSTTAVTSGKSVSEPQPTAKKSRRLLVATLCVALGFAAGWTTSVFNGSTDPFPFVGSRPETAETTKSVTSPPEKPTSTTVDAGVCLNLSGFELFRGGTEDLSTRVVDCTSVDAVTHVVDAMEVCENCQSIRTSNGQRIKFLEEPLVGRCFFAYLAPGGAGTGWPEKYVPCYAPPEQWVLDASENAANRLKVEATELRLVTSVVTDVSDEEPTCSEGSDRWELTRRDPVVWLCTKELKAH